MAITWEVIAAVITVLTFVGGIWFRIESMCRKNTDELSAHKLYVAETYATKLGMEAQTSQIMKAISELGERLEGLNRRLDRVFERQQRSVD